jgi:lipid II:glycine glycyltransferase (peptidoglycan interpeptide bridge formation enzyme)
MNLSKNEEEQLKKFLNKNPKTNFLQSPEWARVKKKWEIKLKMEKKVKGE